MELNLNVKTPETILKTQIKRSLNMFIGNFGFRQNFNKFKKLKLALKGIKNIPEAINEKENMQIMKIENKMIQKKNKRETDVLSHLNIKSQKILPEASWHAPWKLMRVISGHNGWVRTLAMEPGNEWFVSGGADRLIKVWDFASGALKLTLTGHINTVRGLVVSYRHPYLFSCSEDNTVKCWDLEYNKIIRNYHGHLSGVYRIALHPKLDILCTGGRDAVVRVWDIRTKQAVHVLSGHTGSIRSLVTQANDPQIISGNSDKTIRLWDLRVGACYSVLTHHKKSIRALEFHNREFSFCSAGGDNLKVWKCPEGIFNRNIEPPKSMTNCLAIKSDVNSSVLVACTDNGELCFYDWKTGHKFQSIESIPQPGSLSSENGIFDCIFDKSESRLLTAECDKTIKIWKEDEEATPQSHPVIRKQSHL